VRLRIQRLQVRYDTTLLLSLAYPSGTSFEVTAYAPAWCNPASGHTCQEPFGQVESVQAVRESQGNVYHFDGTLLYVRLVQPPNSYTGSPEWTVEAQPLPPFERDGISLQRFSHHSELVISASCSPSAANAAYCAEAPSSTAAVPQPCAAGSAATSYDLCCPIEGGSSCVGPLGEVFQPWGRCSEAELLGDFNADGRFTLSDALAIAEMWQGGRAVTECMDGNVDQRDGLTLGDAHFVARVWAANASFPWPTR